VTVGLLLLGAPLQDDRVRRRPAPQKIALAPVRFEQVDPALGQRDCQWNSRNTTAGADVDDRAVEPCYELDSAQRVVEQHTARLVDVADRSESPRCDNRAQPTLEIHHIRSRGNLPVPPSLLRRSAIRGQATSSPD